MKVLPVVTLSCGVRGILQQPGVPFLAYPWVAVLNPELQVLHMRAGVVEPSGLA